MTVVSAPVLAPLPAMLPPVIQALQAQLARAKVFIDTAIARGWVPATHAAHAFASYADVALRVPVDEHLRDIGLLTPEQAAAMRGRAAKRAIQLKATKYLIVLSGISAVLAIAVPHISKRTSALASTIADGDKFDALRAHALERQLRRATGRDGASIEDAIQRAIIDRVHDAADSLGGFLDDDQFRDAIRDELLVADPTLSSIELTTAIEAVLPDVMQEATQRAAGFDTGREVIFERTTVAWKLGLAWLLMPIAMGALAMRRPPLRAWQAAVSLVGFGAAGVHLSLGRAIQHLPANSALQLVGILALLVGIAVSLAAIMKPALCT